MITQTYDQLKYAATKSMYVPHGMNNGFSFSMKPVEGRCENDSTILVSPFSKIDVTGGVDIGKWVMIGANALLLTHNHNLTGKSPLLKQEEDLPFKEFTIPIKKVISDDVWIFESRILANCNHIAKGVIIGIGSIVTKPIHEEYSIWAGNPAKKIGNR